MIYYGLLDGEKSENLKSIQKANIKGGHITYEDNGKTLVRTVYSTTSTDYGFLDIAKNLKDNTRKVKIQVIINDQIHFQTFPVNKCRDKFNNLRENEHDFEDCRCVFDTKLNKDGKINRKDELDSGNTEYNNIVIAILKEGSEWELEKQL